MSEARITPEVAQRLVDSLEFILKVKTDGVAIIVAVEDSPETVRFLAVGDTNRTVSAGRLVAGLGSMVQEFGVTLQASATAPTEPREN
jgi:hypothetical protein